MKKQPQFNLAAVIRGGPGVSASAQRSGLIEVLGEIDLKSLGQPYLVNERH